MQDLIISNAIVVSEDSQYKAHIAVKDGKISAVSSKPLDMECISQIDAQGLTIIPGGVDIHVHFNEPGRTCWEGWETGSRAAAAGGVTTVADMPLNSVPYVVNCEAYEQKKQAAADKSFVDYILWGGLTDNNLDEIPKLQKEGVYCFKAFMSGSGVEYSTAHDGILYEGLRLMRNGKNFLGVHAENDDIVSFLAERAQKEKRIDFKSYADSRPEISELEAIERSLFWAQQTGGSLHICHVATAAGIERISQAKTQGISVTAETCPHYLFFSEKDYDRYGAGLKCAPPIRDELNRQKLWCQLLEGKIDCVASDHSPCTNELKQGKDIWHVWGGINGIQSTLNVLLTAGCHEFGLTLSQLVKVFSANPARRMGIYGTKGVIQTGADADFVLLDPKEEWIMTEEDSFSKNKNSPYIGCKFTGRVRKTILRGNVIYDVEKTIDAAGYGKLLN